MSTLFSRRPGKGSKFTFGTSSSASKQNKFGNGISNTDLLMPSDGDQPESHYVATPDYRPLSPLQMNTSVQPRYSQSRSSLEYGADVNRLRPAGQTHPSAYDHAADDFGRMTPTQLKPRGGVTLPHSLKSPRSQNLALSRLNSPPSVARTGSDAVSPSMVQRALPPNVPQGEEAFPYGYTHEGWDIEVTQAVATKVVEICGQQIKARGLDSPLIFSSMALDLSASGVNSLIRSFAASDHHHLASSAFAEEAKYANTHNLAAMIKWTLARLGRFYAVPVPSQALSKKGEVREEVAIVQQRGWLEFEPYSAWREQERAANYPYTAFSHFCASIDEEAAQLLRSLFSLLSSTTSYTLSNGMTPSKLARLFGVLLFGLPEDETFSRTYEAYVRASNATEHLLLAHIRDLAAYEVLPVRLMNHVTGYPSMLSSDGARLPSHVKMAPVTQIERNVRLYSSDLIQTACELELLTQSKEWAACCSASDHHGKDPQLSDRFRKLINLRGGGRQGRKARRGRTAASPEPLSHGHSSRTTSKSDDPASYASVAQEEWGHFLFEGFSDTDQTKLNFDLRESQRNARVTKRDTVGWNEFTNIGFDNRDDSLAAVLNFDGGLREDIERWPGERAEFLAKLRESTVKLPPFPYDSNPRVVAHASSEEQIVTSSLGEGVVNRIDEAFAEVWADFLIGNGWSNRDELTHRAANFVVLQYKSRPGQWTVGSQDAGSSRATSAVVPSLTAGGDAIPADDRLDASWFVVQETVPGSYRADLEAAGKAKSRSRPSIRKLNVFRKLKRDKTVHEPSGPPPIPEKESGDSLFPPGTKKLQLGRDPAISPDSSDELDRTASTVTKRGGMSSLFSSPLMPASEHEGSSHHSPLLGESGRHFMTALRGKTLRNRKGATNGAAAGEGGHVSPPSVPLKDEQPTLGLLGSNGIQTGGFKSSMRDDSFGSSDFETRSLHDPEDGIAADSQQRIVKKRSLMRHNRQESKDDAWIDIMMRSKTRMQDQDASAADTKASRTSPVHHNGHAAWISESDTHAVGSHMMSLAEADSDDETEMERSPVTTPTKEVNRASKSPVRETRLAVSSPTEPSTPPREASKAKLVSPSRSAELRHQTPPRAYNSSPATRISPPQAAAGELAAASASSLHLNASPSRGQEDESGVLGASRSVSGSSSRHDDLDAFPEPPTQIPSQITPKEEEREEVASEVSEPSEINFGGQSRIPVRSLLKRVSDKSSSSPESAESARDARVSAAVLRARELRARLQPIQNRTPGETSLSSPQSQPQESPALGGPPLQQDSPTSRKADPFAKNPTSGKVASLAARFGAPAPLASPTSPGATKGSARIPVRSPGDVSNTSDSLDMPPSSPSPRPGKALDGSSNDFGSPAGRGPKYALTKAALETLPSGLVDPDMPPSPRQTDSVLGDSDSLAPDDAASNYSRTTEDSMDPQTSALLNASGANAGRNNWDGRSQAQHDSQQAFQNALLNTHQADKSESKIAEEAEQLRLEEESQDELNALPRRFAEPYQPGQPLDNVFEESESMLSGSNA
ncbi:unnamed protein product [Sympodiomycopsis kandeliae]